MTSAHINLTQLRKLTGDDPVFIIELLEMIESHSPEALTQILDDLERKDYKSLSAVAHKFKSTIHMLGNAELISLVKDIEQSALIPENERS